MIQKFRNTLKTDYLPLILFQTYLIITLLLFYFGPLEYELQNPIKTIFFLITYQVVFGFGFHQIRKKYRERYGNVSIIENDDFHSSRVDKTIVLSLLIAMFVSYISLASFSFTLNPITIVMDIFAGIRNPSMAYAMNTAIETQFISSRYINIVLMLLSILSYYAYAMGAYHFNETKWYIRVLVALAFAMEISTGLIRGTNISIFRMVVVVAVISILKMFTSDIKFNVSRKKMIYIALAFIAFITYFVIGTSSRMALTEIPDEIFRLKVDKDNLIMRNLPEILKMPYIMISFYLSQGYHAFSMTFNYNFHTTFGFGNGWFLLNNFDPMFSFPFFARTYIAKMRYHWSPTINWHSAYTWFANDVSVFGVVVIMYLLGDLLFRVIYRAKQRDKIAVTILPLLILMLLFIPANNVVLSAPQTALPFMFFVSIFIVREFVYKKSLTNGSNYMFLGGVYEPFMEEEYIRRSKSNGIQNAVNTHQWNFINGIRKIHKIEILSARYLHTFPNYSHIIVRKNKSVIGNIPCHNIGFINLPILKQLSKSILLFFNLLWWLLRTERKSQKIFVYYPSSILLINTAVLKIFFRNLVIVSIIPDLPENTNLSQNTSITHKINEFLFNFGIKKIDFFILLTNQMADYYQLNDHQYFVMEGIIESNDFANVKKDKHLKKSILYSGSLNVKYGIKTLVDQFLQLNPDYDLRIYGKGEYENELIQLCKEHSNLKYLGYVSREQILNEEVKCHILVNPRSNVGDFNKYSFPSKNLEYMLSGTPFVGYLLDGMTSEYTDLFRVINKNETIIEAIDDVFNNYNFYSAKAVKTQNYITTHKNNDFMCEKMLQHFDFIGKESNHES